jgi:hypothetical protein
MRGICYTKYPDDGDSKGYQRVITEKLSSLTICNKISTYRPYSEKNGSKVENKCERKSRHIAEPKAFCYI